LQRAGASGGGLGGLFGAIASGINSLFTGGGSGFAIATQAQMMGEGWYSSGSLADFGAFHAGFRLAKGGVISAPALAAYSNSIVAKPTLFPFAKGGAFRLGLMGEAGPEAIIPLRRDPGGRLGVDASGFGARPQTINNITVHAPPGSKVETRERQNQMGGIDTEIFIDMIRGTVAEDIATRRGPVSRALDMRGM